MIYEKLQKARIELQNKNLKKSGKNKFSGFTYYELNDILPQINQIFYDLKMFSNFSINNGIAVLTITDWEDESFQEFTSPIEELELKGCTKIQALGGIHTYMKRYLYLNALEIVESDMLDAKAGDIEEIKPKDDTKIYIQLAKIDDPEEITAFYNQYKTEVNDRQAFWQMANDRKKAIEEISKKFGEEECKTTKTTQTSSAV